MKVRKEVIRVGSYWYVDEGTGQPRRLDVTPEMVRHWHDSGKEMLAAGLSVPVPLEHQSAAKPLTAAERSAAALLNNAGWVDAYEVGKAGDKDALFSVLDVQDEGLAKKLPRTIRWTSPWINSFTDGNGRKWDNVISHVALTTRPRITEQQPFPSVAAALSCAPQSPVPSAAAPGRGLSLSRAGLLAGDAAVKDGVPRLRPAYPLAFSLYSGVKLAREEMPPDKEPDALDKASPPGKHLPPENSPPPERQLVDGDGDISVYDVLCDLLAAVGVDLPDGTTKENFAQRLYQAAMDQVKTKVKPEGDMPETPKPPDAKPALTPPAKPPAPPVTQEQQPMYMSLEQVNAIADPQMRQMAGIMLSLQKNAFEQAKARRQERIDRLAKRVQQAGYIDKLLAMANGCQLSLTAEGSVHDGFAGTLDLLEAGIKDMPSLLTTPSTRLSVESHPQDYTGEMSEERRAEIVEEQCRNAGIPAAKKAG